MSPLRITTLVAAAVLTAACIIALIDHAIKGSNATLSDLLTLSLTCSSLASWLAFVAIAVRDSIRERDDRRFDELAGQLASIAEKVGEYGDRREGHGYLAGVRDTGSGHLTRVK